MHDGAKDQQRSKQRNNHAAIRHRFPGDVEFRLEFIRHELVLTSLQNSDNTGCLSLCNHHIPAGMGIRIESAMEGVTKVCTIVPLASKTPPVDSLARL